MLVYVINKNGKPLMPCKPQKAKKLLKNNKAKIVNRTPFTIQLIHGSSGYTQPITLGIDAGSKIVGVSATTEDEELYSSEATLRNDIVDLLATRASLRRARRNRKTRYRQPRFLNRKKPKGWLAPSVQHKIDSHLRLVRDVHRILPISKIVVEVASFDIQKIRNPDISGTGYQQGEQLNFWNVREYVLWRDGHKCQHCKGKTGDKVLNVHHIESRKTGGDAPNNLITLCKTCHDKHHKGEIELKVKRGASYKDAAFMGIMRWAFYGKLRELYVDVSLTYGYITKNTRIRQGLDKSHQTDAFCITGNTFAKRIGTWYKQKFVRRSNRQLHKATIGKGGVRKANQAAKYVFGFQLFDKVKVLCTGEIGFVFGRRTAGSFDVRKLDGTKISAGISYKKLRLLETRTTILTDIMQAASTSRLKEGVSAA